MFHNSAIIFLITVQHDLNFEVFNTIKAFETSELVKRCSYIDVLTALPDATNDLTLPCQEQQAGAATDFGCSALAKT